MSVPPMQNFHLQQLSILVSIVSTHIRKFAPDIINMIAGLWAENTNLHVHLVELTDSVARALDLEFEPHNIYALQAHYNLQVQTILGPSAAFTPQSFSQQLCFGWDTSEGEGFGYDPHVRYKY